MNTILSKEPVLRAEKSLKEFNPNLNVIVLEQTARTANDAATALGCKVGAIVKCCSFPLGSVNRRSTNSASFSLINFKTFAALILSPM